MAIVQGQHLVDETTNSQRCAKEGCGNWVVAQSRFCKDRKRPPTLVQAKPFITSLLTPSPCIDRPKLMVARCHSDSTLLGHGALIKYTDICREEASYCCFCLYIAAEQMESVMDCIRVSIWTFGDI